MRVPPTTVSILGTVERVFGDKEFLPLSTFTKRVGVDRKTVLRLVADGLLEVYEYTPGRYRKILVSRTSFIVFLTKACLRLTP